MSGLIWIVTVKLLWYDTIQKYACKLQMMVPCADMYASVHPVTEGLSKCVKFIKVIFY